MDPQAEIRPIINQEEGSDQTLAPQERPGNVSSSKTLMNLLKGMIVSGCLALPVAFKQAGLWTGFVLVFLVGISNTHCMNMLVKSAQHLCERSGKVKLDYGELANTACKFGPIQCVRAHRMKALYVVNAVIAVFQVGVCAVYVVFIAQHTKQLAEYVWCKPWFSVRIYMCMLLIPVILINFVRELKILAWFSTVGNILMVVAFGIIFQQLARPPNEISHLPWFTNFQSFAVGLGSILYTFEGQAMILPMENRMRHPENMRGLTGVLCTGMAIVTCIYAATGFLGYASFGDAVRGSVVLNLPKDILFNYVRGLLVVVTYLAHPLQLYVVIDMAWPGIQRRLSRHQRTLLPIEFAFRSVLVALTFILAVAIPKLEDIIPLVGITAGMLIAFVFPPIIETVTFWAEWTPENQRKLVLMLLKNGFLFSLGLFGLTAGLYANIANLTGKKN